MKTVLFAASEGLPFIKSGGLADVVGSLPQSLKQCGYEVRIVLPYYKKIRDKFADKLEYIGNRQIYSGWINEPANYYQSVVDGITYYFVEHYGYFGRDQLYGYDDDSARFGFFQKAVLELLYHINWYPDIIHTHDWHTGMIPLMCHALYGADWRFEKIKHVYTIHNLAFQGNFHESVLNNCLGLDYRYYQDGSVRFDNGISFMKSGLVYADKITTVSPTYSHEILTSEYGERMEEVLRYRHDDLWGIVNGINTNEWNPKEDKLLAKNYSAKAWINGKKANKRALQQELGLEVKDDVMLIGLVSRLTNQKGVYMITEKMNEIMSLNVQFCILGTGEENAENSFKWLEHNYKGRAVYYCGYNEELAHRIYAGSDLFLMPSIYEPCGIGQLIAMHYGALPLVRETGGLKYTVKPYNQYTGEGNGFSFWSKNPNDMMYTIRWASEQYYLNKDGWKQLVSNAMNTDVSWDNSARLYSELYKQLTD